eukprot:3011063-Ditylum_brightwellii.AAC.1
MVIRACGDEAKVACGNVQLCTGLKAGIEGAVHAVRLRWEALQAAMREGARSATEDPQQTESGTHEEGGHTDDVMATEELTLDDSADRLEEVDASTLVLGEGLGGTTLVDARNGFNELSRMAMLWSVCHRWPSGTRFLFNCYRHWALLVIKRPGEEPILLHSREGVTQGDP